MSTAHAPQTSYNAADEDVFLHLKKISLAFDGSRRPKSDITLKFKDKISGFESLSRLFKHTESIQWDADLYVKVDADAVLWICKKRLVEIVFDKFPLTFDRNEFGDNKTVVRKGQKGCCLRLVFATSKPSAEVVRALGGQASSALASKVTVLDKLETVLDFLNVIELGSDAAQLNPIAQAVVPIVSRTLAKFREVTSCHKQFIDIMNDLVLMIPMMEMASRRLQDVKCLAIVKEFFAFVKETSEGLISYASENDTALVLRNWYRSKKDEVNRMKERSTQLKRNLDLALTFDIQNKASDIQGRAIDIQSTTSNVQFTTLTIQRTQIKAEEESVLKRIRPPKLSSFDPDHCCLPGTRTFVIDTVIAFAQSQPARLYWLYGIAGSGKSSIATSVATTLYSRRRLSGAFFCKRDVAEFRNPVNLIHALAYSIAEVYMDYRSIVIQVLREDSRIEDLALSLQFDALFKEPLRKLSQSPPPDPPQEPVVFVIDALDECDDSRSISLFLSQMVELAPCLRFIVTSRPLPGIEYGLQQVERHMLTCDLYTQDAHQDIHSFIRSQFTSGGPLSDIQTYVNDDQIQKLTQKSSGLFIWISTVLSYVGRLLFGKYDALLGILSSDNASGPEAQLDALYMQVLETVNGASPANRHVVKFILALIFVTSMNRSLPSAALHVFICKAGIRVSKQEFDTFLRQMGSVLMIDMQTGAIRVCHPSFLDFIGSGTRSKSFWMRTEDVEAVMVKMCFEILEAGLKFNICSLESATLRNDEVADLKERIGRCIPQELQYSCMYWYEHLSKGGYSCKNKMLKILQKFLSQPTALFWIEVLSVISELKAANAALAKLRFMYADNPELRDTAIDYHTFVTFFHEPMRISTPHVYTSALVWTPSSSIISTKLYDQPLVLSEREKEWPANLQVIECRPAVNCVAYAPDGSRIVCGLDGGWIQLWDALSGTPISAPLKGHETLVILVAFSPDGLRIISASLDSTIRIWDALSGAPMGAPLEGHMSAVWSVAFSPDGSRIVSGSNDSTIRFWDALNGAPISAPLKGHARPVKSVAYSPDGSRVISGSEDNTIRIWNALSGAPIGAPLKEHTLSVNSVAYSPDGSRIVSGSDDNTIRIWVALSGAPIGTPLVGHTDSVISVRYSPDGSRLVSRSKDKTILIWDALSGAAIGEHLQDARGPVKSLACSPDGSRIVSVSFENTICIWDALSGALIGTPLMGHMDSVTSINYSPDGLRIVSASFDCTIRIWDALSDAPIGAPLEDIGSVESLAFSPDGLRIVSGSDDNTICIWDALNGARIGMPLEGHTDSVISVAYSLDGSRIVSGSYDNTIRIWDALSGAPIGSPLKGHTRPVNSAAYSPDGSHIVSGSDDRRIRIWDALSGAPIGIPLEGHTDSVVSVMYSPDGSRIVSGSYDNTIRIWVALSGAPIGAPLKGHTRPVNSVAYSPDGSRVISGSDDNTIRIWDALSGASIGTPLQGHASSVNSVVYSPDGSRIVSGSSDYTIRIWDALSGAPMGAPLGGHMSWILSVACSPDGSRIFSGCADQTIRIWDAGSTAHIPVSISYDGWIRTEDGGLLLWVPREYRNGVCDMSLFSIPHIAPGHPIKIDWAGLRNAWGRLNNEHGASVV